MEYRILGPLEVRGVDGPRTLGGRKQRAVLALLLLNANQVVSRDRLVDELWSEDPPKTAATTVQVYVSRLRKLLSAGVLQTRPPGYVLFVDPDDVDVFRFECLVAESGHAEPEQAARLLREALALWRGPALEEFDEPFARLEGGRLEDVRLAAVEARIDADLACGRDAELVGELEALVGLHPQRERLRRQLALALYRSGRQAEALAAYREARAMLDELGLEPGSELRELELMILTHDPGLSAPSRLPAALPTWPTAFVGRSAEAEAVRALIVGGHRLVTLTGTGGVGKTRLAAAVAERAQDGFTGGAFFVPLTEVRDPAAVRPAIAQVLGIRAGQSLDVFLHGRALLLVLDNVEQLVDGGGVIVADLLRDAPRVSLLVTSREPLGVRGEQVHTVPPLGEEEAIDLFVARAREFDDAFRLTDANRPTIAAVCERLDGLPLALELAAAHVRTLEPDAILSRLDQSLAFLANGPRDAPTRQQTIRATIAWSHDLLDAEGRQLFARLAAFRGGCTLEAAEAVCGANVEGVQSLIAKSLLRHRIGRYSMLQTIREFAGEQLALSGEREAVARAHADHFIAFAENAERNLDTSDEPAWFDRLERDHDNLRAALAYCAGSRAQLHLACTLWRFWMRRGHHAEGRRWLDEALRAVGDTPSVELARGLRAAAAFARIHRDLESAERLASQSISVAKQLGDRELEVQGIGALSEIALYGGEFERAVELMAQLEGMFGESGDENRIAIVRANRAYLALEMRDFALALTLGEQALTMSRQLENPTNVVTAALNVAMAANELGDRRAAIDAIVEALAVALSLRHRVFLADGLVIAAALVVVNDPAVAGLLVAAAERAREEMKVDLDPLEQDLLTSVERKLISNEDGGPGLIEGELDDLLDAATSRALQALATSGAVAR